jgi:hypothetical protein
MKPLKKTREAHAMNTKFGMGDFYGQGVKNPVAKLRESFMTPNMTSKKLKKPPKSLA